MTWKELKQEMKRQGIVDNDVIILPILSRRSNQGSVFPKVQFEVRVETKRNSANIKLIYGVE